SPRVIWASMPNPSTASPAYRRNPGCTWNEPRTSPQVERRPRIPGPDPAPNCRHTARPLLPGPASPAVPAAPAGTAADSVEANSDPPRHAFAQSGGVHRKDDPQRSRPTLPRPDLPDPGRRLDGCDARGRPIVW